ncbi:hypothetical protein [Microvirga sp. Mcv34]|uniref:hypothetical protein n=1 Tax=Microvirga sp. Mcv34 TaxID=2926016 RepID=UPI0021CAA7C9|nr:hypothetical protein [Microvirga sp. Mcv34]
MKNVLIGLGALALGAILLAGDASARGGGGDRGGMTGGAAVDRGVDVGRTGAVVTNPNRTSDKCPLVPVRRGTQTMLVRRC